MGANTPKTDAARTYVLAHPDESKTQQAAGAGCSEQLIAEVRRALIAEGKLAPSRKAPAVNTVPPPADMLDHDAMMALADIAALDDLDDDEIQRRMLKQCIRFSFDPRLHADTRMSAATQWAKLREWVKAKDLGPGPPMTRDALFTRYKDLTMSIGDVDLVVEVLFASYTPADVVRAISDRLTVREAAHEGVVPAQHSQATPGAAGTSPAP